MIAHQNTLISEDIFEKKFVCDLTACKGKCCVSGDSGAPLEKSELKEIEKALPFIINYLTTKKKAELNKQGNFVIDNDGDYTTPLINGNGECVYLFYDNQNIAKCSFEKAYLDGQIKWKKPISCHLYPIRITKLKNKLDALNYEVWDTCKAACVNGVKLGVTIFSFLKEPLIRKYGKTWYTELEQIYQAFQNSKNSKR